MCHNKGGEEGFIQSYVMKQIPFKTGEQWRKKIVEYGLFFQGFWGFYDNNWEVFHKGYHTHKHPVVLLWSAEGGKRKETSPGFCPQGGFWCSLIGLPA